MGLDGRVPGWTAVLPVKGLDTAKSRLAPSPAGSDTLALAFVNDALLALSRADRVDEVLVVTADAQVMAAARAWGAGIVDDSGHEGINAAAAWGAAQRPHAAAVVVVVSDLPALDAMTVDAVLGLAERHEVSYLPDASGTGTTMWCTTVAGQVHTRFGPHSAQAHASSGARDLSGDVPEPALLQRARRDVDTWADLEEAARLGVGPATAAVLSTLASRS